MPLSAEMREQLISSFGAERAEHVQALTDGLLALEQGRVPDEERPALLESLFRSAHTLKGTARALGITPIEQLGHGLENILAALQQQAVSAAPALCNACYRALDAIQAVDLADPVDTPQVVAALRALVTWMETGSQEQESPAPAAPAPASPSSLGAGRLALPAPETIRVSATKLDALMTQLSELLVTKIRTEQRLTQIHEVQEFMAGWQKEWLAVRGTYAQLARRIQPRASVDARREDGRREQGMCGQAGARELARLLHYVGQSQERLRDMQALINDFSRVYANDTLHMALVIDDLEQELKRARMLPLGTITSPFARMVRDLAQASGKEVHLEIHGAEVELDKHVLEQVKDPLIHLLRNAVDHGVESPERRLAAGKPRLGTVTLTAEQLGKDAVLCIQDDGAGLDLAAIRAAAQRRGYQVQDLQDDELAELIFSPGVTTSHSVTDVSGRGVGLDIVRRNVEALRGRLNVSFTPGQGTVFALTLPLALTSSRGLLVRVSGELYAIPLGAVERILRVPAEEVLSLEGHAALRYNGRPLTLVHLGDLLGLPRTAVPGNGHRQANPASRQALVVVLAAAERRMAFVVDELAGEQEIVIKGLGKQLARVGGIAGATVLGNGDVVLILNIADLMKLVLHPQGSGSRRPAIIAAPESAAPVARRRILIVDDSITTRTLEKNILEAAGYHTCIATDGQQALETIAAGDLPDLIVSDIAMPRLDGIGLTRRIKSDSRTVHIPLILVSSLASPQDQARGLDAGADAYIVKSSFDQNNLLETIEQLV